MKTKGMGNNRTVNPKSLHTQSADITKREDGVINKSEIIKELPEAPPNYRGMIYDMAGTKQDNILAEGLNRLAREDPDNGFSSNTPPKKADGRETPAFNHFEPPLPPPKNEENTCLKGLKNLAEGMEQSRFSPEDMLICAMIILMLNSASEDDILMILVLMILL